MTATLILGLIALAVVGSVTTTTALAQTEPYATPLDVRVQVTDVLREHGVFSDKWTFTIDITNRESKAVTMDVSELYLDVGRYGIDNDCISRDGVKLNPGQTKEFIACFLVNSDLSPASLLIGEFVYPWETPQMHIAPFVSGECTTFGNFGASCGRTQNIDRLIRDMEPEPLTCEVPVTTTTPTQTITEPDTGQPQLLSVAYHATFADLVLSFDEDITLADSWQDNITIGGVSIGERANNHMTGSSSLAWISVDYAVRTDLRDVDSHTVAIEPGTFLDADGNTNDRIVVQAAITG